MNHKAKRLFIAVTAACLFPLFTHAALPASGTGWTLTGNETTGWTVNDVVDGASGWNAHGSILASNVPLNGLTPVTGTGFLYAPYNDSTKTEHGLSKIFSGLTLQTGTYTATFSIGDFNNTTFAAPNAFLVANGTGWANRIITGITAVSRSTPGDGQWTTWTYTFDIAADTKNASNVSAVGTSLGFYLTANTPLNTMQSYAIDNLSVSFTPSGIPEPAAATALMGLAALGYVATRRGRRRA